MCQTPVIARALFVGRWSLVVGRVLSLQDQQHGGECSIDCGAWPTARRKRSLRVQLKADATLSAADVGRIRWNLCV